MYHYHCTDNLTVLLWHTHTHTHRWSNSGLSVLQLQCVTTSDWITPLELQTTVGEFAVSRNPPKRKRKTRFHRAVTQQYWCRREMQRYSMVFNSAAWVLSKNVYISSLYQVSCLSGHTNMWNHYKAFDQKHTHQPQHENRWQVMRVTLMISPQQRSTDKP